MQLNRTGIFLIAFFGLSGIALLFTPLFVLGVGWMLVALGLLLYARAQQRKAAHNYWIFQQGLRGNATVLSASSRTTVNEMPLMSLRLELDVPGQVTREVKRREIMPVWAARRMQPGLVLPAYVNPKKESEIVLVW